MANEEKPENGFLFEVKVNTTKVTKTYGSKKILNRFLTSSIFSEAPDAFNKVRSWKDRNIISSKNCATSLLSVNDNVHECNDILGDNNTCCCPDENEVNSSMNSIAAISPDDDVFSGASCVSKQEQVVMTSDNKIGRYTAQCNGVDDQHDDDSKTTTIKQTKTIHYIPTSIKRRQYLSDFIDEKENKDNNKLFEQCYVDNVSHEEADADFTTTGCDTVDLAVCHIERQDPTRRRNKGKIKLDGKENYKTKTKQQNKSKKRQIRPDYPPLMLCSLQQKKCK